MAKRHGLIEAVRRFLFGRTTSSGLSVAKRHGLIEAFFPPPEIFAVMWLSVAKRHGLIEAYGSMALIFPEGVRYPWQNATASLKLRKAGGFRSPVSDVIRGKTPRPH